MKVQILESVEVTDEQRYALAAMLDGKKRLATRVEAKDFIWRHGSNWANVLAGIPGATTPPAPRVDSAPAGEDDEDLLGTAPVEDDGDLLGTQDDDDLI